jgi:hypothetical protein
MRSGLRAEAGPGIDRACECSPLLDLAQSAPFAEALLALEDPERAMRVLAPWSALEEATWLRPQVEALPASAEGQR